MGCRIQDPGTRGYRWWKTADFSHSACTAHGAPPVGPIEKCTAKIHGAKVDGTNAWCCLDIGIAYGGWGRGGGGVPVFLNSTTRHTVLDLQNVLIVSTMALGLSHVTPSN